MFNSGGVELRMAIDFFSFWVEGICGSALLSVILMAFIFAIIGVLGRMSYFLLFTLLALFFMVFGLGFLGIAFYLPIFIFSMVYFFIQIYKFLQKTD